MNTALLDKANKDISEGIQPLFNQAQRVQQYTYHLPHIDLDLTKTHVDDTLLSQYLRLAQARGLVEKRADMFAGKHINNTEDRAVLHTLLRDSDIHTQCGIASEWIESFAGDKKQFGALYRAMQTQWSERKDTVRDIVHIGIGGSVLGPQLLYEACQKLDATVRIHFVSNIDAHQLVHVLSQCDAKTTIVIGVSKTFTTTETLQNLNSVQDWFVSQNEKDYNSRMYAVTSNPQAAMEYGIAHENIAAFPNSIGGRYSIWSSVSLSTAFAIGMDTFDVFLAGAAQMDQYFYTTPLAENACFINAALDHYYHNYLDAQTRAIFAYDFRLRSLVPYLQQLETESNGKDRQCNGEPVDMKTSSVVWGGVGTDVQHSVFQMLHQGSHIIPAEFILVKQAEHNLKQHHDTLLANGIAQSAALLSGQTLAEVQQLHKGEAISHNVLKAKVFAGNKPSATLLLQRLSAKSLGALLAFYEHRAFCLGVLCNINSYDQMGVELGKRLATAVLPVLQGESDNQTEFDASTKRLIHKMQS